MSGIFTEVAVSHGAFAGDRCLLKCPQAGADDESYSPDKSLQDVDGFHASIFAGLRFGNQVERTAICDAHRPKRDGCR